MAHSLVPLSVIEATQAQMTARMLEDKGHAVAALAIRQALRADTRLKTSPQVDHLPDGDGRREARCRE